MSNIQYVGMTVANMERSIEFYSQVLSFQKIKDIEVAGADWEKLQGVFGLRMRIVQMQLGDEIIVSDGISNSSRKTNTYRFSQ